MHNTIQFVIIGNLAFDRNITPKGDHTTFGGGAYLVSVGASLVVEPFSVGIVARAGKDFTEGIALLKNRNIDTSGVFFTEEPTTCFCMLQKKDNTRHFTVTHEGASSKIDTSSFSVLYRNASHVHLATAETYKQLIWLRYIRKYMPQATISVDTFEKYVKENTDETLELIQNADIVFINEDEYVFLSTNVKNFSLNKPYIMKSGPKGAIYKNPMENITIKVPAKKTTVVDTTGAGDILAGVFLGFVTLEKINILEPTKDSLLKIKKGLTIAVDTASRSIEGFGVDHLPYKS